MLTPDAFGNVVGVVDSTTFTRSTAKFRAYGPVPGYQVPELSTAATLADTSLWHGKHIDPTGLYYFGARYYDPASGRFISPDPLGHAACMDLYTYAGCNPVNGYDPDGRLTKNMLEGDAITSDPYSHALHAGIAQGLVEWGSSMAKMAAQMEGNNLLGGFGTRWASQYADSFIDQFHQAIDDGFDRHTSTFDPTQGKLYGTGSFVGEVAPNAIPIAGVDEVAATAISKLETTFGKYVPQIFNDAADSVGNGLGKLFGFINCFPPGTKVLMADGTPKAIETIVPGEHVLTIATNHLISITESRQVVQTHHNWTEHLISIQLESHEGDSNNVFKATGEHPIWTQERGWVNASQLAIGDHLLSTNSQMARIVSVERQSVVCDTYNLSVEEAHVFFVLAGDVPVLVHNTGISPATGQPFDGGSYSSLTPSAGVVERHHIPAWSTGLQNSYSTGMAVEMDYSAHLITSSWGNSADASLYRDFISNIAQQDPRKALAIEIQDVRNAARESFGDATRYNDGLLNMLEYGRQTGQVPCK